MSDQRITCQECKEVFLFSEAESAFYAEKGLAAPPKRCKTCRQARKDARGGTGAPAARGGGPGGAPRRYSGNVNEYRSPMSGGHDWARGGGAGARRGGSPRPNGNAAGNGPGRGPARGPARAPSFAGNGFPAARPARPSEYRSPAFPEARGGGERAPRRAPAPPPPKAPRAPRPGRPKYDITCGECGVAAQVPFKPLEGRQVFCQDCYRARREAPREVAAVADVTGTDTGIVE